MPIELTVEEMGCEGCEHIVRSALEDVDGVESAEADRHEGTAVVEGDADEADLIRALDTAGYEARTA